MDAVTIFAGRVYCTSPAWWQAAGPWPYAIVVCALIFCVAWVLCTWLSYDQDADDDTSADN